MLFLCTKLIIKIHNMADTEKDLPVKKISKKDLRKAVYEKLSGALAEYKSGVDEKKFDNKLKKISKFFALDIAKAAIKNGKLRNKNKVVAAN